MYMRVYVHIYIYTIQTQPQLPTSILHHLNLLYTSPSLKFRRFCMLCFSGGRGVQTSSFSLAWLAEELIHRNKIILISCSSTEGSARPLREGVYDGRGLHTLLAQEVAMRRSFPLPQYTCVHVYICIYICTRIYIYISIVYGYLKAQAKESQSTPRTTERLPGCHSRGSKPGQN